MRVLYLFSLIICLNVVSSTVCPEGTLKIGKFNSLTNQILQHSSTFFSAMYQIKQNQISKLWTLFGYKLNSNKDSALKIEVPSFTLNAAEKWSIQKISQNGTCVIIKQDSQFVAYQTSQNTFQQIQRIPSTDYTQIYMTENCSVIRILKSQSSELYKDSILNSKLKYPLNSKFDTYFVYGIDNLHNLYKLNGQNFEVIKTDSTLIQNQLIQIYNRKQLNMLILFTKNSQNSKFILTIFNTLTDVKLHQQDWKSTELTGEIYLNYDNKQNFLSVSDDQNILSLMYLNVTGSVPIVYDIHLFSSDYKKYFGFNAAFSYSKDVIISYYNKKVIYLQIFSNVLYKLGELSGDIQTFSDNYVDFSSKFPILYFPTVLNPANLVTCSPAPKTVTEDLIQTQDQDVGDLLDGNTQTSIDSSGKTLKCRQQCVSCKVNQICQVCAIGYAKSSAGKCIPCHGCRDCVPQDPSICTACFIPYVLDLTINKCIKVATSDPYCQLVSIDFKCKNCRKGYSLHNNICTKCPDACQYCTISPNTCDVSKCKPGYIAFQSQSGQYDCVQCATGCLYCNHQDLSHCKSCNVGFFGKPDPQTNALRCNQCTSHCILCTGLQSCQKCKKGYHLNQQKTSCLINCHPTCKTCSDSDITVCLSCYSGNNLFNEQCFQDDSCNFKKTCQSCADNYALRDGQCLKCTNTDPACAQCNGLDLNECVDCVEGYYLDGSKKCLQCGTYCSGCLNQLSCYQCSAGYYLSTLKNSFTGSCLACSDECKTCNEDYQLCTSCDEGGQLIGSKCKTIYSIFFSATVGVNTQLVISIATGFVKKLIIVCNNHKPEKHPTVTSRHIILNQIKSGSSIISGWIVLKEQASLTQIASSVKSEVIGTNIGGYPVISIVTNQPVQTTNLDSNTNNTVLILAIAIPLSVLFCLVIVFLIVICGRRRDKDSTQKTLNGQYNDNTDTNAQASESQKHIDHRVQQQKVVI